YILSSICRNFALLHLVLKHQVRMFRVFSEPTIINPMHLKALIQLMMAEQPEHAARVCVNNLMRYVVETSFPKDMTFRRFEHGNLEEFEQKLSKQDDFLQFVLEIDREAYEEISEYLLNKFKSKGWRYLTNAFVSLHDNPFIR